MSRSAKTAGPRPVSTDLPPHLQPMAITKAAPKTDRRVAILGALVVYGGMPLGLLTLERMMPKQPVVPKPPVVIFDDILEMGAPTHSSSGQHASALPAPAPPPLLQAGQDKQENVDPEPSPRDEFSEALSDPTKNSDLAPANASPDGVPGGKGKTPGAHGTTTETSTEPGGEDRIGRVISIESTGLQILHQVDPLYPAIARAAHIQGNVVLRMLVDERGVPIKVDVVEGPAILQGEAVRAATQWRFVAARVGDQTAKATFLLTIRFKLS